MKRVQIVNAAKNSKRVGATVAVDGNPSGFFPNPFPGPFPGDQCGCPSFPLPIIPEPLPLDPIPGVVGPPGPTGPAGPAGRVEDIGVSANILPQTIAPNTTAAVALGGINFATGGATVSGNTITLPRAGKYLVAFSALVNRPAGVDGMLTFNLTGGVIGGNTPIDGYTLGGADSGVFNGSIIVSATSATSLSLSVTNSAGNTANIVSGVLSAQLLA